MKSEAPLIHFDRPAPDHGRVTLLRGIVYDGVHHVAGSEVQLPGAVLSQLTAGEDYNPL